MTNEVPFFSLIKAPDSVKAEWGSAIKLVIESGQFIGGPQVKKFEENWATSVGVKHAVGVGNGLDGLVVALRALGVGAGDYVAVPAHTFIATWNAIKLVDATPIGIDVDDLGLMDLDILEALDIEFKCVIPVHMHGAMVDMKRLTDWAKSNKVLMVEDASQSHLAISGGVKAGQVSDIGVFSLYPTKNLGALGDAGVIVTDDDLLATKVRSLTNYGASANDKYFHESFGVNSRLDSLQAAVLNVNLKYLDQWNDRRRTIAIQYIEGIKECAAAKILNRQPESSVWHHFPIISNKRDELMRYLKSNGITGEIHYPRTAAEEYFEITGNPQIDFPKAQKLAGTILSLPISPWHTSDEIQQVCDVVNSFSSGD